MPKEIEAGRLIDRFGAQAVYGRTLGISEIRRIVAAENVLNSFRARENAGDWAKWSSDHPELAELLEIGAYLTRGNNGGN